MAVCTGISALQLAAVGFTFLLTVLWLEMFWVKIPHELHKRDLAPTLKRQPAQSIRGLWRRRRGGDAARLGRGLRAVSLPIVARFGLQPARPFHG